MGFCRQDYWSGLPSLSPGDLSHLGIKPASPALQVDSLLSDPPGKPILYYTSILLPRSVGAQYVTGEERRSNSRKNEGMEPKQKQHQVVDVTGVRSKV